ncbi:hypothetical protein NP493_403g02013 [Ridgeia piscesae]|uniref:PH domain-containing protein n=1 Tax=Ridgeia piscesae TaxID=27915 RepID=A0AAD9L1H8_RIDPI|nr:hypothetical protein NP493_403g02013 [Ridgeia piscesae]
MSVLNEIGWTNVDGVARHSSLNRGITPQSTYQNRKAVPLKLCYLCQNIKMPDTSFRTFELHSPDGTSCIFFRCPDEHLAREWMSAVHGVLHTLLQRALVEANELLKGSQNNSGEVCHMGWLADQVSMNDSHDNDWNSDKVNGEWSKASWKPVFVALTDKNMLLYDKAPRSRQDWAAPYLSHSILATRLVHSGKNLQPVDGNEVLTFSTRSGTRQGVTGHQFRVETPRDLAQWTRVLVQGSHDAAGIIKEVNCPVIWQTQQCQLTLHYENGFTLTTQHPPDQSSPVLWHFPFEKMQGSADDGTRLLWLNFGDDGEQELDLQTCPKPIVFILHTFLSAKVARLGLVA